MTERLSPEDRTMLQGAHAELAEARRRLALLMDSLIAERAAEQKVQQASAAVAQRYGLAAGDRIDDAGAITRAASEATG